MGLKISDGVHNLTIYLQSKSYLSNFYSYDPSGDWHTLICYQPLRSPPTKTVAESRPFARKVRYLSFITATRQVVYKVVLF